VCPQSASKQLGLTLWVSACRERLIQQLREGFGGRQGEPADQNAGMFCEEDDLLEAAKQSEAKAQLETSREAFLVDKGWQSDLQVTFTSLRQSTCMWN